MKLAVGVNLFGAEAESRNAPLPGKYGFDYRYPDPAEADYFAEKACNIFRLPVKWERWQTEPGGELNAEELARAAIIINHITRTLRLPLILDVHNYGKRRLADGLTEKEIGDPLVRVRDFADFWRRIALRFGDNDKLIFCVMNEPITQEADEWAEINQAVIDAVRETGATQKLQLSGTSYSSAHLWYGAGNAKAFLSLRDPLGRFEVETHIYGDRNADGLDRTGATLSDLVFPQRLQRFTDWCRRFGFRAFLGEIGISQAPQSLAAMQITLDFLAENADIWSGVTFWAGGSRLNADYPFRLSPHPFPHGEDKPQMQVIENFMRPQAKGTASFKTLSAPTAKKIDIDLTAEQSAPDIAEYFDFSRDSAGVCFDVRGKSLTFPANEPRLSDQGLLLEDMAIAAFPIWADGYFKDSFRTENITIDSRGAPPENALTLVDTADHLPHYLGFDADLSGLKASAAEKNGLLCFSVRAVYAGFDFVYLRGAGGFGRAFSFFAPASQYETDEKSIRFYHAFKPDNFSAQAGFQLGFTADMQLNAGHLPDAYHGGDNRLTFFHPQIEAGDFPTSPVLRTDKSVFTARRDADRLCANSALLKRLQTAFTLSFTVSALPFSAAPSSLLEIDCGDSQKPLITKTPGGEIALQIGKQTVHTAPHPAGAEAFLFPREISLRCDESRRKLTLICQGVAPVSLSLPAPLADIRSLHFSPSRYYLRRITIQN